MKIGIIGIGFVGKALMDSFIQKNYILNDNLFVYDKYKSEYSSSFDTLLNTQILFLTLPTLYIDSEKKYDLAQLEETLDRLRAYTGLVIIKSTVEPLTCLRFYAQYDLKIIHNPEFLTARTALDDFNNQKHIILGTIPQCNYDNLLDNIYEFYKTNYPNAKISICSITESESVKLFLNCFYAVKVQFFTEIYLLCDKLNIDYENVKTLMLNNGWINPMHTTIPGPDGNISYGGMCFPKDTNALCNFMLNCDSPCAVLDATVKERNMMRE